MSTSKQKTAEPDSSKKLPDHIAIIMDGNGRWAKKRFLPRFAGHKAGVEAVRNVVKYCAKKEVKILTLFAFSSENWRRPKKEVTLLMNLLMSALKREVDKLHENNVRLKIIGDTSVFDEKLREQISNAELLTANNQGLKLVIAVNYGGRWDIVKAAASISLLVSQKSIEVSDITEALFSQHMTLAAFPDPDLFIRTGGEKRISNFLLWNLAYTEIYFTDDLWPDFDDDQLEKALISFSKRQRRFGRTSEQLETNPSA